MKKRIVRSFNSIHSANAWMADNPNWNLVQFGIDTDNGYFAVFEESTLSETILQNIPGFPKEVQDGTISATMDWFVRIIDHEIDKFDHMSEDVKIAYLRALDAYLNPDHSGEGGYSC